MGYTGETAEYFQLFHVTSRIERFEAELEQRKAAAAAIAPAAAAAAAAASASAEEGVKMAEPGAEAVKELFPFHDFFANAPQGNALFGGLDMAADLDVARGCFRHINKVGFAGEEEARAWW